MRLVGLVVVIAWLMATALRAEELTGPIDLNTATVEQLQKLPGIGPKKAEAIVSARNRRPFTRVTQLLEVRGIGKRTLDRLKPFVTVDGNVLRMNSAAVPIAARPGASDEPR